MSYDPSVEEKETDASVVSAVAESPRDAESVTQDGGGGASGAVSGTCAW